MYCVYKCVGKSLFLQDVRLLMWFYLDFEDIPTFFQLDQYE
jgi:hypothetical protein